MTTKYGIFWIQNDLQTPLNAMHGNHERGRSMVRTTQQRHAGHAPSRHIYDQEERGRRRIKTYSRPRYVSRAPSREHSPSML